MRERKKVRKNRMGEKRGEKHGEEEGIEREGVIYRKRGEKVRRLRGQKIIHFRRNSRTA
jgi:hypothetical protein